MFIYLSTDVLRRIVIALIIFGSLLSGCSWQRIHSPEPMVRSSPAYDAQFDAELLRKDVLYALEQIALIHPDPYARVDKQKFDQLANQRLAELRHPMTLRQFYLLLAPLIKEMKDAHTYLHLLPARWPQLPLALSLEDDGRLYVVSNLGGARQIPIGATITAIDGASIDYLMSRMWQLANAETESGKRRWLQVNFSRLLEHLGHRGPVFTIEYEWRGQHLVAQVNGLPPSSPIRDNFSMYGFSKLSERTALLWFNDFAEEPSAFARFLAQKFAMMKQQNIKRLIIDLRFNDGGTVANMQRLASYLTSEVRQWHRRSVMRASEPLRQQFFTATKVSRKANAWAGLRWLPLEWTNLLQQKLFWSDGGALVSMELPPVSPAQSDNFANREGKVWVVSNGYCYSACATFIALTNQYHWGKTLGEAAGSLVATQFAYPVEIVLPNSGLTLSVATSKITMQAQNDQLLEPSQPTKRPPRHIEARIDTVLAETLRQAEQ